MSRQEFFILAALATFLLFGLSLAAVVDREATRALIERPGR